MLIGNLRSGTVSTEITDIYGRRPGEALPTPEPDRHRLCWVCQECGLVKHLEPEEAA
jgi:hypothetical protein